MKKSRNKYEKLSEIVKETQRQKSQEEKLQRSEKLRSISERRSNEKAERERKVEEWRAKMNEIRGREYAYIKLEEDYK